MSWPAGVAVGDLVRARMLGSAGVDLTAGYLDTVDAADPVGVTVGASRP